MNAKERYPVAASLFMLGEMKRRHEQVYRGYQLLRRKAESLRYKGRKVARELAAVEAMLGHTLKDAYISLPAIKFTNGESNAMVLENIGEAQVRVKRIIEHVSGVPTVSLVPCEVLTASDSLRYAGLGAGGARTAEAKKAFRKALMVLIQFASLRNTSILLGEAMKSTLRKVNGIEKVMLPKLHNTELYILTEMDEMEREDFHRLKLVKAKKVKSKDEAHARKIALELEETDAELTTDDKPPLWDNVWSRKKLLGIESARLKSTIQPACLPCLPRWDDDDLLF